MEDCYTGRESAIIVLDQSKAYDCISHPILLGKMEILGFQPQACKIMGSFLTQRKQFVQVQAHRSEKLDIGPNSVIQGSTLSCVLFLMYILYMPQIYHDVKHNPTQYRQCPQPNLKTFVDDAFIKADRKPNQTLKQTITKFLDTQQQINSQ